MDRSGKNKSKKRSNKAKAKATKPNNGGGGDGDEKKSVRFSASVDVNAAIINSSTRNTAEEGPARKRPRIDRPNPDEEDDVDEWTHDDHEEDAGGTIPSQQDLIQAKRQRRQQLDANHDNFGETTNIDSTTSLAAASNDVNTNDAPIEPFDMKQEEQDGTGYFDGDTYVFRRTNNQSDDGDGEPDAWLDSLKDHDSAVATQTNKNLASGTSPDDIHKDDDWTDWSREDLYAKILPLVSDSETILKALIRYGDLIKQQQRSNTAARQLSHQALQDLTKAANTLLMQGDVDIYQKTRLDIMNLLPSTTNVGTNSDSTAPAGNGDKPLVQWEYKGNQDHAIHGPYSTQQMLAWTKAGYFCGTQAVQIRTISTANPVPASKSRTSTQDLLSDLMDDDDDGAEEGGSSRVDEERGEWKSSNHVDFHAYS